MRSPPTELPVRSEVAKLPPRVGAVRSQAVLHGSACAPTWRVVEAASLGGMPFELDVRWAAASGAPMSARATVGRSTRVCVFARSIEVQLGNLAGVEHDVAVHVADSSAFVETRNVLEWVSDVAADLPLVVPVPPLARSARLEVGSSDGPSGDLTLWDGLERKVAVVSLADMPPEGVLLAGVRRLESRASAAHRVVFALHV